MGRPGHAHSCFPRGWGGAQNFPTDGSTGVGATHKSHREGQVLLLGQVERRRGNSRKPSLIQSGSASGTCPSAKKPSASVQSWDSSPESPGTVSGELGQGAPLMGRRRALLEKRRGRCLCHCPHGQPATVLCVAHMEPHASVEPSSPRPCPQGRWWRRGCGLQGRAPRLGREV